MKKRTETKTSIQGVSFNITKVETTICIFGSRICCYFKRVSENFFIQICRFRTASLPEIL